MSDRIRLDKWLWHGRFFKTRSLAAKVVAAGKVRVDGTPVSKPSRMVEAGQVLTFPMGRDVRVVRILALGERRGPAPEAQGLYDDLDPPKPREADASAPQRIGARPTKKDRRQMDRARAGSAEGEAGSA